MPVSRSAAAVLLAALPLLGPTPSAAAEFSVLVSPPRFEAAAKPGQIYRGVIELTNVSTDAAHYRVHTADWTLDASGSVQFADVLAPGSCRPWVGIEAAELNVAANAKRRYRFEVAVPPSAPVGECRFAIMIEGDPGEVAGRIPIPVAGRIGVIVYLAVGDAAAKLDVLEVQPRDVAGERLPVLQVRNSGNAHGRLEGFVDGTDARGRRYSFTPATLPILPGETRAIALTPEADTPRAAVPALEYPLVLKGRLDSAGQPVDIALTVAP